MMSKRVCFHIDEDDFIGVGYHITLTDGNSVPVSGQYNQSPSNKVLWWAGVHRLLIFKIRPNILIGLQKLRLRPKDQSRSRLFIYLNF